MKKTNRIYVFLLLLLVSIWFYNEKVTSAKGKREVLEMNQPLITDMYTADPSAHVFKGKLYIYPSHDLVNDIPYDDIGSQFDMKDYHVFSIRDFNSPVVDHGEVLHVDDIPWATRQLWAPDAAYKNGTYYLYFPAKDKRDIFRIGVATSKKPYGPFKARPRPIKGSFSMDPAVFVDDDGQAYMYFGGLSGGQLENWQNGSYDPDAAKPAADQPALGPRVAKMARNMLQFKGDVREVKILDETGNPVTMNDSFKMFFEAAWMHKYKGVYYLSYSTGYSRSLAYATGTSPYGPFTWRGIILNPVMGWTTHHSIVKYRGKWYLFYHTAAHSEEEMHLRTIKYTELFYNDDGTIQQAEQ